MLVCPIMAEQATRRQPAHGIISWVYMYLAVPLLVSQVAAGRLRTDRGRHGLGLVGSTVSSLGRELLQQQVSDFVLHFASLFIYKYLR